MAFCNPCTRPADSSIVNYVQRPSISIKTILRRQLFKKSSIVNQTPHQSSGRFQRIKGTNIVREVNPLPEYNIRTDTTNNYDMTVFHDDELDDTQIALSRRRSKKIPRWARKSQLQLAVINQIYFNDNKPEDIFDSVHIDLAREMVQSIKLPLIYSSSNLPPNFV